MARAGRFLGGDVDDLAEAPGRVPDTQPAVAEASARRTAASERPPTMIGIGGAGAGRTSASLRSKNSPWNVVGAPVRSCRRTRRHSSIRLPRVAGSTPQISTS
jgi:hypothetical protein